MAYGVIKIIPASQHVDIPLSGTGGGTPYPSVKVLNPNDGVIYCARNRDCLSAGYGDWDWKVPSQSYAMLPGPFSSIGAFYLDQSGAGRQGEVTFYPSQQHFDDPMFLSIGRALQAVTTSLDITEGTKPANPGSGIARLWADGVDFLHVLNGAGVDAALIDTLTSLGGALIGNLPNPQIDSSIYARIRGGNSPFATGEGLELAYDVAGHSGNIVSYDRSGGLYRTLQLVASAIFVSAQNGGLSFGATGSADFTGVSGTVNFTTAGLNPTLGTWTPALSQGAALTLSSALGRHIKIGRFVFCIFSCAINSAGTAANYFQLSGMPYTSSDITGSYICDGAAIYLDSGTAFYTPFSYHNTTTTVAFLTNTANGNFGQVPGVTAAAGDSLQGFLVYEA